MDDRYDQENVYECALERMKERLENIDMSILKDKTILFDYDYSIGPVVSHVEDVSGMNNLEFLEKTRNNTISFFKQSEEQYIKWYKEFVRIYLTDYFRLPGFCQFHVTYPLMADVTPEISIEIPFENMVALHWPVLHAWKSNYEKYNKLGFICDEIVFFCKDEEGKLRLSNIGDGNIKKHIPVYQKDDFLRRKDVWNEKESI